MNNEVLKILLQNPLLEETDLTKNGIEIQINSTQLEYSHVYPIYRRRLYTLIKNGYKVLNAQSMDELKKDVGSIELTTVDSLLWKLVIISEDHDIIHFWAFAKTHIDQNVEY